MIDRDDPADPPDVLLVEPTADGVRRAERAVEIGNYEIELHVVPDESACLDFLRQRDAYADAPQPGLVIFGRGAADLRSASSANPDRASESGSGSGREAKLERETESSAESLLEAMADDAALRRIPVVVCLPSTATPEEIRRCYDRRANAVVPLPDDDERIVDDLQHTLRFWIAAARLPNPDRLG